MNSWLGSDWDRGYEKGRLAGVAEEQARIINLLEGYQGLTGMFALERDDLIVIIKGENNE